MRDREVILGATRSALSTAFTLCLALALSLPVAAARTSPAEILVVKAAAAIDGTGAAPIRPAMIRIEGDRIVEVGKSVRVPPGARTVDLGDATLLPGLIDLHTHLTGDERVHWEDALVKSTPPRDALWGARNARLTLMAGFTSVRDMGPTWPYVDVELRRAIDEGVVPGPRMMVAGNYVYAMERTCRARSRSLSGIGADNPMGWQKDVGALSAGRYADIIAVPGDPLADISVLDHVGFVIKGGVIARDDLVRRR